MMLIAIIQWPKNEGKDKNLEKEREYDTFNKPHYKKWIEERA